MSEVEMFWLLIIWIYGIVFCPDVTSRRLLLVDIIVESLPDEKRTALPHVRQQYNWDCGLACAQMILRHYDKNLATFKNTCDNLNFGTSVWTVDLAYIMQQYNVKHHLCTITLGVDKGYSKKGFYKDSFSTDETRVNNLFLNAETHGLSVERKSVSLDEILQHLSNGNTFIILIDWSHLNCRWCHRQCFPVVTCVRRCICSYQGHFVVVCGYNKKERLMYYKNPSYREELCCCSFKTFETARKASGTDEDLLFIYST